MLMKANSSFPFVFVVAHNRLIPQQYMESSGISRILAFVHVLIPIGSWPVVQNDIDAGTFHDIPCTWS